MRIELIAVGTRMPAWVDAGYREYAKRLPAACALQLREIPGARGTRKSPAGAGVAREGERMLAAVGDRTRVIALAPDGAPWTTEGLAKRLAGWMRRGDPVALLVGGADGLAPGCRERAETAWSLSPLTLPHGMVRVIVAEQLYRAWSILGNHPYHRG